MALNYLGYFENTLLRASREAHEETKWVSRHNKRTTRKNISGMLLVESRDDYAFFFHGRVYKLKLFY